MRKIVVTEFISLDGVFEAPGPDGSGFKYEGWTSPYGNDEFQEFKSKELEQTDILLLGRITYDAFAIAWPKMEESAGDFGKKFNSMPKYVLSNTLENPTWKNSHVIKGENAIEEIKKLKAEDGGDITVHGSGTVARFLLENKLVDQINLLVYPVVLGEGKRLFDGAVKTDLKLVESQQFKTGVFKLIYKPKK
jgi:dihydrofolate reductase